MTLDRKAVAITILVALAWVVLPVAGRLALGSSATSTTVLEWLGIGAVCAVVSVAISVPVGVRATRRRARTAER